MQNASSPTLSVPSIPSGRSTLAPSSRSALRYRRLHNIPSDAPKYSWSALRQMDLDKALRLRAGGSGLSWKKVGEELGERSRNAVRGSVERYRDRLLRQAVERTGRTMYQAGERFQTHCRVCAKVFEADTPDEAIGRAEEHEKTAEIGVIAGQIDKRTHKKITTSTSGANNDAE